MKKDILFKIQLIIFNFILIISLFILHFTSNNDSLQDFHFDNEGWDVEYSGNIVHYDFLPKKIYSIENGTITISKKLSDVKQGYAVGFFSFQQTVSVSIDGKEVYSFKASENAYSKTPGNKWNIIMLSPGSDSINLSITINECYTNSQAFIPDIYFGTQTGIILHYLKHVLPRAVLSMLMIVFGFSILIYYFLSLAKKGRVIQEGLVWLGLFGIFRGCWTVIEANFYSYFFNDLVTISRLSYLFLKMAAVTFIIFINVSFYNNNNKVFNILKYLSIFDFASSCILQYTGLADFAYTLYLTHLILIIGCVYTTINSWITLIKKGKDSKAMLSSERQMAYNAQLGATLFLLIGSLVDLYRYYFIHLPDIAKYSRIGDLIFIVVVTFGMLMDFVYLLKTGKQAAIIKEKASLDSMTEFRNRATFESDISKAKLRRSTGIIVLDLNNLKFMNDTYGHDLGDEYIISSSKLIEEIFSDFGLIYRIGGDEFCIISHRLNQQLFSQLQEKLERDFKTLPIYQKGDKKVEIASGFALFDKNTDTSIKDIMKKADEEMYKRKEYLKNKL